MRKNQCFLASFQCSRLSENFHPGTFSLEEFWPRPLEQHEVCSSLPQVSDVPLIFTVTTIKVCVSNECPFNCIEAALSV